jgi:hypothetical protein
MPILSAKSAEKDEHPAGIEQLTRINRGSKANLTIDYTDTLITYCIRDKF